MLPYLWLSLAIVWLWLPPQISARGVTSRLAISIGWLTLAVVHGYAAGLVTPLGVIATLTFALLCYRYSTGEQGLTLRVAMTLATILFSLALMAHVVPGFSNLLVVRDADVDGRSQQPGVRPRRDSRRPAPGPGSSPG